MRKKDRIKNMLRYDNTLNKVKFGSLNSLEQNLLFAIICGMYGKTELVFDLEALRRFASGSATPIRKDRINDLVIGVRDTLFNGYITERVNNEEISVHLFRSINFVYDNNNDIVGLKVIVDEMAVDIFDRKQCNLTIADYDMFSGIRSTYVKTIFRLLSQYKGTGVAWFKYDEFLYAISCPESYKQENIKERILEPAVKTINDYFKDLKYELIKEYKMGRKVITAIAFTFKPILYKPDISEGFKELHLEGNTVKKLKDYNKAIEVITSSLNSAESIRVASLLEREKIELAKKSGIYNKIDEIKDRRFDCLNDISKKLERKNNESL